MSEAKKREVTQLLREYRAFHTAFGGTMTVEESMLRSAEYTSGGLIMAGAYYERKDRRLLAESYRNLEYALTLLRREDFPARMSLSSPYTGSEADPAIADHWRQTKDRYVSSRLFIERHDRAIDTLASHLANVDLYVVWPKRSNSRDAESVEKRNDEAFDAYKRFRRDGLPKKKAVKEAARFSGYTKDRIYKIVSLRESRNEVS